MRCKSLCLAFLLLPALSVGQSQNWFDYAHWLTSLGGSQYTIDTAQYVNQDAYIGGATAVPYGTGWWLATAGGTRGGTSTLGSPARWYTQTLFYWQDTPSTVQYPNLANPSAQVNPKFYKAGTPSDSPCGYSAITADSSGVVYVVADESAATQSGAPVPGTVFEVASPGSTSASNSYVPTSYTNGESFHATAISKTSSGLIYVAGYTLGPVKKSVLWKIGTGGYFKTFTVDTAYDSKANALKLDSSGTPYICGTSGSVDGGNAYVAKWDTSTNSWKYILLANPMGGASFNALDVDANGVGAVGAWQISDTFDVGNEWVVAHFPLSLASADWTRNLIGPLVGTRHAGAEATSCIVSGSTIYAIGYVDTRGVATSVVTSGSGNPPYVYEGVNSTAVLKYTIQRDGSNYIVGYSSGSKFYAQTYSASGTTLTRVANYPSPTMNPDGRTATYSALVLGPSSKVYVVGTYLGDVPFYDSSTHVTTAVSLTCFAVARVR